jgi:cytochrome c55X
MKPGPRLDLPPRAREGTRRSPVKRACAGAGAALALLVFSGSPAAQGVNSPSSERQQHLVRMVRQDCGSCHGLLLTGGLGPALTPAALRDWPIDSLVATILNGRAGTPMPPWARFVTEDEAAWIARNLRAGFPQEPESRR